MLKNVRLDKRKRIRANSTRGARSDRYKGKMRKLSRELKIKILKI